VPAEFSRPEVLEVLRAYYATLDQDQTLAGRTA
jgi:ATP sulfurylase